jgi:transcriptional regulator with XRE-family HTH domain
MTIKRQKTKLGGNIRRCRTRLGISQDVLSKRAGLAFHTIAKIESGSTSDPRIDTVKKIADALGISLDDLLR